MKSHKKAMRWVLSVTALALLLSIPLACGPASQPAAAIAPKALERVPREQLPENLIEADSEAYEGIRSLVTGQNDFVANFYRHLAQEGEATCSTRPTASTRLWESSMREPPATPPRSSRK